MVLNDALPLVWCMSTKKNTADSIFGLKEADNELLGGKTQRAEILVPLREIQISLTSVLFFCKLALLFVFFFFF